ncbi:MAG: hypothetical protein WED04_07170 [Promethearchaeati archaeon SRVP18_Atabeyarchaeia-1]
MVKELAETLDQLGIDYAIVGGIAATSWGNVRTTLGIDVVMNIKDEDVPVLAGALRKRDFSLTENDIMMALKEKSHFTTHDEKSLLRIDAKGAYGPRELETLRTKKKILIGKTEIYLASPEDMIANKLFSGSEQDTRDAEGIYARQFQHIDVNGLRSTARKLGVSAQLSKMDKRMRKRINNLSSWRRTRQEAKQSPSPRVK